MSWRMDTDSFKILPINERYFYSLWYQVFPLRPVLVVDERTGVIFSINYWILDEKDALQ